MKGLVFAGCSFTWGQGLYYYSGLETLKEPPPNEYDKNLLTDSHIKYMEANRFPRLVANEFNTFEFVKNDNGGSDELILDYLDNLFDLNDDHNPMNKKASFNEIDYIIYQTTQPLRSTFFYNHKGKEHSFNNDNNNEKEKLIFYEWLIEERNITLEEWHQELSEITINKIKEKLKFFEKKGVKTLLICWTDEYMKYIKNDIWLYNRLLKIEHDEVLYNCIDHLQDKNNHLIIYKDYNNLEKPPHDNHPSLECHKIIANSIINKLHKDSLNTYEHEVFYDNDDEISNFNEEHHEGHNEEHNEEELYNEYLENIEQKNKDGDGEKKKTHIKITLLTL